MTGEGGRGMELEAKSEKKRTLARVDITNSNTARRTLATPSFSNRYGPIPSFNTAVTRTHIYLVSLPPASASISTSIHPGRYRNTTCRPR